METKAEGPAAPLKGQSRSGNPGVGPAGGGECSQLLNDWIVNVFPPLMKGSPAAVEAPPGGSDSRWHWLSFPLLRLGSFVPRVSSVGAGHRSQLCAGSEELHCVGNSMLMSIVEM